MITTTPCVLINVENQVASFRIPTKDGERLFAWLIAPLGLYAKHADSFVKEQSSVHADIEQRLAFSLLRNDPDARLLIYCTARPLLLSSFTHQ
jgi:abhydrolase domain-containing protein 12